MTDRPDEPECVAERRQVCARCGHEVPTCPRCGRTGAILGGGQTRFDVDGNQVTEHLCHGVDGTDELVRANGGTCYELSTRLTLDEAFARYTALRRGLRGGRET